MDYIYHHLIINIKLKRVKILFSRTPIVKGNTRNTTILDLSCFRPVVSQLHSIVASGQENRHMYNNQKFFRVVIVATFDK